MYQSRHGPSYNRLCSIAARTTPAVFSGRIVVSDPAPNGLATVVNMQTVGNASYYDAAGFPGRTVGLSTTTFTGDGN